MVFLLKRQRSGVTFLIKFLDLAVSAVIADPGFFLRAARAALSAGPQVYWSAPFATAQIGRAHV